MAKRRMAPGVVLRTLDQIDAVLAAGGPEAKKLWDILSALRGPDVTTVSKDRTTSVIRAAAFPLTATKTGAVAADFNRTFEGAIQVGDLDVNTHFKGHIREAAKALGLDLDDRTPQERAAQPARPVVTPVSTPYRGCGGGY